MSRAPRERLWLAVSRTDGAALGSALLLALPAGAVLAVDLAVVFGEPWTVVAPLTALALVPLLYVQSTPRARVGTTVLVLAVAAFLFPLVVVAGTTSAAASASDPLTSAGTTVDGMALFMIVWAFAWVFAWVAFRAGRRMRG